MAIPCSACGVGSPHLCFGSLCLALSGARHFCVFLSRCESGAFFVSSFSILVPSLPRICFIRPVSAVSLSRIQFIRCFAIVPF